MAAPPDMQRRSVDASALSARFAWSIALYIVGTPWNTVTRSRSMISSAFSGSKRGIIVTVAPLRTAQFIVQVWPKVWKSGSAPSSTSSCEKRPSVWAEIVQFLRRFGCVSSAPLGWPVVPDV